MSCPNCGNDHGPRSECALAVLADIANDRGELSNPISADDIDAVDLDAFWDSGVGASISWLETHVEENRS